MFTMVSIFLKRHKSMIRASIFFFCVGCGIALCFIRIECANAVNTQPSSPAAVRYMRDYPTSSVEYAVLVLTGPSNEDRRNAIRSTWGNFISNIFTENGERLYKWTHSWREKRNPNHNFIKVYFVIGIKGLNTATLNILKAENSRTNDIIFLNDLFDKYENLALKVKLSFKWLSENLKELKYVIKCDDDSFVRVDLIVKDLEAFAPEMNSPEITTHVTSKIKAGNPTEYKGLYWGYFNGQARVQLKGGKWKEEDWFLCDNYLPYALGGCYVVSRSIVDFVAKNSDFLSCYRSEDVSMGVWTAPLDGINRVHDVRFDAEWMTRGCLNNMLVRHKQNIQNMFQMYKTLVDSKGTILCGTETLQRGPYDYNWSGRPSQCCKSLHPISYGNKLTTTANVKSNRN